MLISGLSAKIKYLASEDSPSHTFDYSNIDFGSLQLEFGNTEDLVTKLVGIWKTKYTQEEDFRVVLQNNVSRYGLFEESYDIFIYNSESFVVKCLTYWMIQYSNTWKHLSFSGALDSLHLDMEDTVTISLPNDLVATTDVVGRVKEATYDSASNTISYLIKTEVRCGESTPYVFAYPASAPADAVYPTANDPNAGA